MFGAYLDEDVADRYKDVEAEFSASRGLYCAQKTCSSFIPESDQRLETAICPACDKVTCRKCRQDMAVHVVQGSSLKQVCPSEDEDEIAVHVLGSENKWKQCPSCWNMVERVDGCNHMECICGIEFCYNCGRTFDEDDSCACEAGHDEESDGEDARREEEVEADEAARGEAEWPDHTTAIGSHDQPSCPHLTVEEMADALATCHGCLKEVGIVYSCDGCKSEFCEECLDYVRSLADAEAPFVGLDG
jgi:hypothetical protein